MLTLHNSKYIGKITITCTRQMSMCVTMKLVRTCGNHGYTFIKTTYYVISHVKDTVSYIHTSRDYLRRICKMVKYKGNRHISSTSRRCKLGMNDNCQKN